MPIRGDGSRIRASCIDYSPPVTDLIASANRWISGDPDPTTRQELQSLVDAGDTESLSSRLGSELTFGTAGLRGEVGAGPNRMNRAVVIRTTAGLASYLDASGVPADSPVVVGFDARPTSRTFAEDTAGVLAASGRRVVYFPEFAPTPLVAFALKDLGAAAAVVVTASHNPPADNGYKVYSANGAQIIPPVDAEISAEIARAEKAVEVARTGRVFSGTSDLVSAISNDLVDKYWNALDANRPDPHSSDLKVVYTPMHGVGGEVLKTVFRRAGHTGLIEVPEQAQPDGTFPTVSFPNPEEPGALDLAIDLGSRVDADLIIANDPDADRLAALVPHDAAWRALTGNELGVLLGDYVLRHWNGPEKAIVINSVVSSPMLGRLAEEYGARYEVTLTGFKWIVNAGLALEGQGEGVFAFGYEEALGYTVGSAVRDKDGISAALVFCDLYAGLQEQGLTVLDRLAELWNRVGVWASTQHSLVRSEADGQVAIEKAVNLLAADPPDSVGGNAIVGMIDYRGGGHERPFWLGEQPLIELSLGASGRILVRPSGTEPKLKIYVDLTEPALDNSHAQQRNLERTAVKLASALASELQI